MMHRIPTVALIGVGGYGQTHLQTLTALEGEGLFQLTDVVEPAPERVKESLSSLQAAGVRCHRSWEELAALEDFPDCVLLPLPISLHAEYARRAYERGAWVYLEKPPVPLLGELDELIAMEGDRPRIQVGFQFAHSLQMRTLQEWIAAGRLGQILQYRLSACRPRSNAYYARAPWAGRLVHNGRAVLDGPVTNALAHGVQDIFAIEAAAFGRPAEPVSVHAELYRSRPIQSYDIASVHGVFPSGARFAIALSHAVAEDVPPVFEVIGTNGKVEFCGPAKVLQASFAEETCVNPEPTMVSALRAFFQSVIAGEPPRPGLRECRPFVAMTNAMLLAAGTIHDIPAGEVVEVATPDGVMRDVNGLGVYSRQVVGGNLTFSQVGAPWGKSGGSCLLDDGLSSRMELMLRGLY